MRLSLTAVVGCAVAPGVDITGAAAVTGRGGCDPLHALGRLKQGTDSCHWGTPQEPQPAATRDGTPSVDIASRERREPRRLFAHGQHGLSINGWLSQSFTYNKDDPADHYNGTVTFPDASNRYQLGELWATIADDAIVGGDDWSIGARVDLAYGSNYRFMTSAGLESDWNTGAHYGVAMPNAYVDVGIGSVHTKIGHFVSPVGFVTLGTANNFFNVLPYTFQYGEAFTHTGVITTWSIDGSLDVSAGIINGWDSTANWPSQDAGLPRDAWNRHVGAIGTFTKKNLLSRGDSLACVFVWSQEPDITGVGRGSRYLQTVVYTRDLGAGLSWTAQSDFGAQSDALPNDAPGRPNDAHWYGFNQYLTWKIDDEWQFGANLEWFRDDVGFRVVGPVPSFGTPNGRSFGRGPFPGNFYRVMVGPRWQPHPNLIVRPAVLFDVYDGPGAGGLQPFDDGQRDHQLLATLEVLLLF